MGVDFQVTFDAAEPERLGRFWGGVLAYVEQPPPDGEYWFVLADPEGNEFCVQ